MHSDFMYKIPEVGGFHVAHITNASLNSIPYILVHIMSKPMACDIKMVHVY